MYSFESRVRYSETDEKGRLTVLGLINYMQDCSIFHSAAVGVGVDVLEARHKAWMLSSWQILVDRWPRLGENLVIGTWHNESRGIHGYRNFVIRTGEGESLARAGSVWFLYDLDKKMPVRVEEEDIAPYGRPQPKLDLPVVPRKIQLPKEYEVREPVHILRHHLDSNHHVNNAQYVEMVRELLPEELVIREIRAEYRRAALLGDVLYPRIGKEGENVWVASLCNSKDEACANIWIKTEQEEKKER